MPPKPKTPSGVKPAQPARLLIDAQALEDFEIGAELVALLVCPAPDDHEQRQAVFLGICAYFAAEQTKSVPAYADYMRTVRRDGVLGRGVAGEGPRVFRRQPGPVMFPALPRAR